MEPMVIFGAGVVVYCCYLTLVDAIRDGEREKESTQDAAEEGVAIPAVRGGATSATARRAGGAAARWPRPLTGSV